MTFILPAWYTQGIAVYMDEVCGSPFWWDIPTKEGW